MKRFIAAVIFLIYTTASSGATINFHYCMGKFIGCDIAVAPTAMCSNCGMYKEQKKGCCNDKHAILQLKKDQLASTINYLPNNTVVYIQHNYPSLINSSFIFKDDVQSLHSPPLIQKNSAYIFNCAFRV